MQDRFYIAAVLREIGRLLGLNRENAFKARAFERGARALENFAGDFDALVRTRRLTEIAGIGNALAAVIGELYETGESSLMRRLQDELPPGAVDLAAIPGMTLKKITAIHEVLGVENVDALKAACEKGLVRGVKGFGLRAEAKLLSAIEKSQNRDTRIPLDQALQESERILEYVRAGRRVLKAETAGALRRGRETVATIIIVAATEEPEAVVEHFSRFPAFSRFGEADGGSIGTMPDGMQGRLVTAFPSDYPAALHHWTGSRKHIAKLQQRAAARGMMLGPEKVCGADGREIRLGRESDIYRRLDLQFIPPELREDEGEIEAAAAGALPCLLESGDIRGMVHCHTYYSDGQNSIEEMARAAESMGMAYLTITDHSPSAFYARGVKLDRLFAQWEEIARVQERVAIKLLKGTESDILQDGALDYPDAVLERFDVIIASIHARYAMSREQMTARLLRALKLPVFKIWGHPLGRIVSSRPPVDCRIEEILDAVAESRAATEINGDPHRLDLEPRWIRAARQRGIRFVVSTDAHSTRGLGYLRYGVAMARRGWLSRVDVLNTLSADEFLRAVHP